MPSDKDSTSTTTAAPNENEYKYIHYIDDDNAEETESEQVADNGKIGNTKKNTALEKIAAYFRLDTKPNNLPSKEFPGFSPNSDHTGESSIKQNTDTDSLITETLAEEARKDITDLARLYKETNAFFKKNNHEPLCEAKDRNAFNALLSYGTKPTLFGKLFNKKEKKKLGETPPDNLIFFLKSRYPQCVEEYANCPNHQDPTQWTLKFHSTLKQQYKKDLLKIRETNPKIWTILEQYPNLVSNLSGSTESTPAIHKPPSAITRASASIRRFFGQSHAEVELKFVPETYSKSKTMNPIELFNITTTYKKSKSFFSRKSQIMKKSEAFLKHIQSDKKELPKEVDFLKFLRFVFPDEAKQLEKHFDLTHICTIGTDTHIKNRNQAIMFALETLFSEKINTSKDSKTYQAFERDPESSVENKKLSTTLMIAAFGKPSVASNLPSKNASVNHGNTAHEFGMVGNMPLLNNISVGSDDDDLITPSVGSRANGTEANPPKANNAIKARIIPVADLSEETTSTNTMSGLGNLPPH